VTKNANRRQYMRITYVTMVLRKNANYDLTNLHPFSRTTCQKKSHAILIITPCKMKALKGIEKWAEEHRKRVWGENYRRMSFPVKLHVLLSREEYSDDLWWVHDGQAFAVDRNGYKKNIMSTFFNQSKFRSLQTLLWKYGFCTIEAINTMEKDIIIYRRKFFVKQHPELCKQIVRIEHASGLSHRHVVDDLSNILAKMDENEFAAICDSLFDD